MKSLARKMLGEDRYAQLVPVLKELLALLKRKDLPSLARIFGSDKWGHHRYANHYQRFLQQLRKTKVVLLEITIGGYADPQIGMIVDGGSHINTHVRTTFETHLHFWLTTEPTSSKTPRHRTGRASVAKSARAKTKRRSWVISSISRMASITWNGFVVGISPRISIAMSWPSISSTT